jgi:NAD-dependent deacetylase
MDAELKQVLTDFASSGGRITVLSGAGISAESGIPTFRGPEGYWTVGAAEYHPQEMATLRMFRHTPEEVWAWYLYRLGVCRAASPNPGHHALVQIERLFGERFTLITQNVDGLHLRAGSSPARTLQIHGNVFFMRCAGGCGKDALPIPAAVPGKARGEKLTAADRELLRCPKCGALARPHVLWFDEYYDEASYRFESALRVAGETDLLITVGASGSPPTCPTRWPLWCAGGAAFWWMSMSRRTIFRAWPCPTAAGFSAGGLAATCCLGSPKCCRPAPMEPTRFSPRRRSVRRSGSRQKLQARG